jgi:hypothetical protein
MRALVLTTAALSLAGCEIDVFVPLDAFGGPAGALRGAVTYAGPPPCTRGGRIIGTAVLFAFDETALPPPEGFGLRPAGLAVVDGEELFAGVRGALAFDPQGGIACPPPGAASVIVTAPWSIAPLPGGVYQVRGFYDYDGDFHPAFSVLNLPSRGDVAGGAIDNPAEALSGAPPRFRRVPLGDVTGSGARRIGETGAVVEGVAVTLALPLPLERPLFRVSEVLDAAGVLAPSTPEVVADLPADYRLQTFDAADPAATEASFVRMIVTAGVAASETTAASASPFFMPVAGASFLLTREDTNRDGKRDRADHIPETPLLPSLAPLGLLARIEDGAGLRLQTSPTVVMQAVTLRDDLIGTATSPPDVSEQRDSLTLALRPAALCVAAEPARDIVILLTHATDAGNRPLVEDPQALEAAVGARFGRKARLVYGCLPEGRYATSLVYETGQAWTLPNEAGVCAAGEAPTEDGLACGARPRLSSQAALVRVGAARDPAYCAARPTPAECVAAP